MQKALEFVRNLDSSVFDVFGSPEVELYSDCCEVTFTDSKVIKSIISLFNTSSCDGYRLYGGIDGSINVVFTFNF